jgi:hypothetical protein
MSNGFELDRTPCSVGTHDDGETRHYWQTKTPQERLAALEFLRQLIYGYDPVTARLQRALEFDELPRRSVSRRGQLFRTRRRDIADFESLN